MVNNSLTHRDIKHIWHPCTQMKSLEKNPPLIIHQAKGSYLYTDQGPIIDAISSWWCKSLGHGYPPVIEAVAQQLSRFEHVIGAGTTHSLIVELAEQLASISGLQHVFFASDGACSVEIAMKLAIQASQLKGHGDRNQFIALSNGYHGETIGALSVSDLGLYKTPFDRFGVTCHFMNPIPYVSGIDDPSWESCETEWATIHQWLETIKPQVCAMIIEPIIQGAGGMRCYSADFLRKLAVWAKSNDIFLIADEIMTGMCRTGKWLACDHAGIKPDLICLSKGLTSGTLPLSCVLIDSPIYELFYSVTDKDRSFLHSHTYSGNALAVSAALATVKSMSQENTNHQAEQLGFCMRQHFSDIAAQTQKLSNMRSIGAMVAADLEASVPNVGQKLQEEAIRQGALLRPLGNTLYWLPPLNTDHHLIGKLAEITLNSIQAVYK